jgi:hypothetical protein
MVKPLIIVIRIVRTRGVITSSWPSIRKVGPTSGGRENRTIRYTKPDSPVSLR